MRTRKPVVPILLALFAFGGLSLAAAEDHYQVINGPKDFYFGHISLVDIRKDGLDPVVLRSGASVPEPALLNTPLGPGDTIRTSSARRVEIQFDNATILRLDTDSELLIETILAQSLSSSGQISNLSLRQGRMFIMYKSFSSKELFQILTPKAAIKLKNDTVAVIGLTQARETEVEVKYGKASVLYGPDPKSPKDLTVHPKERVLIALDDRFALQDAGEDTDFESWNRAINADFEELHKGKTPLPKAVQRLPGAVFYFAQKYGNLYGEWIYDAYFGYVWRPYYNDHYPWGTWAPYFAGRWANYNSQMFWIPTEPWGWIPYHLGVWQWDKKKGWFWLPGSAFAPAWVDWAFFGGTFCSWRPWSMWDWGWSADPYNFAGWTTDPEFWYYGWRLPGWDLGLFGSGGGFTRPGTATKVSKDQLKPPSNPAFQMPGEFKAVLQKLMLGLQKHDAAAVESMLAIGTHAVVLDRADLNAGDVRVKALPLRSVLDVAKALPASDPAKMILGASPQPPLNSALNISRVFQANAQASLPAAGDGRPGRGDSARNAATARALASNFRPLERVEPSHPIDWNPDVRMARQMGFDIRYSSRTNEVVCPQLNLTSHMVQDSSRGGDGGGSSNPFSGAYSGGSNSGGSGVSQSAGTSQAVTSANTSSSSSNAGSNSGKIKN